MDNFSDEDMKEREDSNRVPAIGIGLGLPQETQSLGSDESCHSSEKDTKRESTRSRKSKSKKKRRCLVVEDDDD